MNLTSEQCKIIEIKNKVKEAIHRHMTEEGQQVDIEKLSSPIICIAKERRIESLARNDMLLSDVDKSFHLCAVEKEVLQGAEPAEVSPVELVITQPKSSFYIWKEQKPIT
jgi:hypothetical protein